MSARDDFLREQGALYDRYLAPTQPVPPSPPVNPPLWLGDFSTGSFSQWRGVSGNGGLQAKDPSRFAVVASPFPGWSKAGRFTVRPGDNNVSGSGTWERCELLLPQEETGAGEGIEQWWADTRLYDGPVNSAGGCQFHPTGAGGPGQTRLTNYSGMLGFDGYGGGTTNTHWYATNIGPLAYQTPYEVLLHARWSVATERGFLESFVNGVRATARKSGPTLFQVDQDVYYKFGLYRAPVNYAETVTLAGARLCATYADAVAGFKLNAWPATVPA